VAEGMGGRGLKGKKQKANTQINKECCKEKILSSKQITVQFNWQNRFSDKLKKKKK
jgi:hypothetical protein